MKFNMKVANDNGNSEHDILINETLIQAPNVYAKTRNIPMLEERDMNKFINQIEDNLIVSVDSQAIGKLPINCFIGNYATGSGEYLRSIDVTYNDKLNADLVIINTLGQIAGQSVKQAFNDNKSLDERIEVNVSMVTALPVNQYSKKNGKTFSAKFTDHKHTVKVFTPNGSVEVVITFDYVKTLAESILTTFFLQNYNKNVKRIEEWLGYDVNKN